MKEPEDSGVVKYEPVHDVSYNTSGSNDNRSVFVLPRRAYYDTRKEYGKPRNVVIILAEVHDEAVNTILACELNGHHSHSVKASNEDLSWVRLHKPGHTHCLVIVQCIGLPQESIINGSYAKLLYKREEDNYYSRVESEEKLILPSSMNVRSTPSRGKGSTVVCTTLYGLPKWFDEWLKYQKTIGVDMVHLNVHSSFYEKAEQTYPFFKQSLHTGFIRVEVWRDIVGKRIFYYSQIVKYQDCAFRYMGMFEYGLFYDYDDFFNPLLSDHKDIHYYLNILFIDSKIGTVRLPWKQMECGLTPEKVSKLQDGNLTRALSGSRSSWRDVDKCVHRLNAILFVSIHKMQSFLPHYRTIRLPGDTDFVYVAHVRQGTKQCSSSQTPSLFTHH